MKQHQMSSDLETGDESDNVVEGWIDKMMLLSPSEHKQVKADIHPVKLCHGPALGQLLGAHGATESHHC
jgi:hypothetical protein